MILTQAISGKLQKRLDQLKPFFANTPLYPITRLHENSQVKIFAKLEWQQLGGSVKSRPAFNIIQSAIRSGLIDEDRHLLDATSGNTGIAYAIIGAKLGVPVTLCLPENASEERKTLLHGLGANLIFTSKFDSTDGAQDKARELVAVDPDRYLYADQYNNDENWKAHYHGTGVEVYRQAQGKMTHFVAGLGTTGTFVGTGRRLKKLSPDIKLIALQPDTALHGMEGWKHLESARVPGIYDPTLADAQLFIETFEAYELIKKAARLEGLLLSPSSAANLAGAIKVSERLEKGVIVTVFPDNAEKYREVIQKVLNEI